jgi:acid stress chaperone HdeB
MVHDSIASFETEHLQQRQSESLVKRTLFVGSAIVFLTASSMAPAQVTVDVSKITCDEFVKYDIADPRQIAAWISGYHHGSHNNAIVDKRQTLGGIKQLEEYCFKHPNELLMKEADQILGAQ